MACFSPFNTFIVTFIYVIVAFFSSSFFWLWHITFHYIYLVIFSPLSSIISCLNFCFRRVVILEITYLKSSVFIIFGLMCIRVLQLLICLLLAIFFFSGFWYYFCISSSWFFFYCSSITHSWISSLMMASTVEAQVQCGKTFEFYIDHGFWVHSY